MVEHTALVSLSAFLRECLAERGLQNLPQKQLWQHLKLNDRSPETYRKTFFEDHIPSNLNDLDEIAEALSLNPLKLKTIAYIQQAPTELRMYLASTMFDDQKFPWQELAPSVDWTKESLLNHVKSLYEIEGFECTAHYDEDGVSCDLICSQSTRITTSKHAIWFAEPTSGNSISAEDLNKHSNKIDRLRTQLGAQTEFRVIYTGELLSDALGHSDLKLVPLDVFEEKYFEVGRDHLESIIRAWRNNNVSLHFEPLDLMVEMREGLAGPHENQISHSLFPEWLNSKASLLVLHGPFGTGKTSLLEEFSFRLSELALSHRNSWFPIFIRLKDYRDYSWEDLIKFVLPNALRELVGLVDSRNNWKTFITNGPFVIFLEGLDEYELTFSKKDRDCLHQQLKELIEAVTDDVSVPTKIIISVRTEMFVDDQDMSTFFDDLDDRCWRARVLPLKSDVRRRFLANAIRIRHEKSESLIAFDDEHLSAIESVIAQAESLGQADQDGSTLARPLFVQMIADNWDAFHVKGSFNLFEMHHGIVQRWLTREIQEKGRNQLGADRKREFLRYLARRYEIEGRGFRLQYKKVPHDICEFFDAPSPDILDEKLEQEVRLSSFVERNSSGEYFFRYTSFAQYCSAEAVSNELNRTSDMNWRLPDPEARESGKYVLKSKTTFGRNKLSSRADSVFLDFLGRFKSNHWSSSLYDMLLRARHPEFSKFNGNKYTTSNSMFLLCRLLQGDLSKFRKDWSRIVLSDVDLSNFGRPAGCELSFSGSSGPSSVRLSDCDLSGTYWGRVTASEIDFSGADLSLSWFHNCDIDIGRLDENTKFDQLIITGECTGQFFEELRKKMGLEEDQDLEKVMAARIGEICPAGFVYVPGRKFVFGGKHQSAGEVEIDPIFISEKHITNADFHAFMNAPENRARWGDIQEVNRRYDIPYFLFHWDTFENKPVGDEDCPHDGPAVWTNFFAAFEFARWKGARLITEAEYESARLFANIEQHLEKLYDHQHAVDMDFEGDGTAFTNLKIAMLSQTKEWCMDFWVEDVGQLVRQRLNPRGERALNSGETSTTVAPGFRRTIRGSGENGYFLPSKRESMVTTNVNPDIAFRICFDVWQAMQLAINERTREKRK